MITSLYPAISRCKYYMRVPCNNNLKEENHLKLLEKYQCSRFHKLERSSVDLFIQGFLKWWWSRLSISMVCF